MKRLLAVLVALTVWMGVAFAAGRRDAGREQAGQASAAAVKLTPGAVTHPVSSRSFPAGASTPTAALDYNIPTKVTIAGAFGVTAGKPIPGAQEEVRVRGHRNCSCQRPDR